MCVNAGSMGLRSNREIRIALYAFFLGIIVAFIVARFTLLSPKSRRTRKLELIKCDPDPDRSDLELRGGGAKCPECPANPVCPMCPEAPLRMPDNMGEFIIRHIEDLKEGPLVVARTRMKS